MEPGMVVTVKQAKNIRSGMVQRRHYMSTMVVLLVAVVASTTGLAVYGDVEVSVPMTPSTFVNEQTMSFLPEYHVVQSFPQQQMELRNYAPSVWVSTTVEVTGTAVDEAMQLGYLTLMKYFHGENSSRIYMPLEGAIQYRLDTELTTSRLNVVVSKFLPLGAYVAKPLDSRIYLIEMPSMTSMILRFPSEMDNSIGYKLDERYEEMLMKSRALGMHLDLNHVYFIQFESPFKRFHANSELMMQVMGNTHSPIAMTSDMSFMNGIFKRGDSKIYDTVVPEVVVEEVPSSRGFFGSVFDGVFGKKKVQVLQASKKDDSNEKEDKENNKNYLRRHHKHHHGRDDKDAKKQTVYQGQAYVPSSPQEEESMQHAQKYYYYPTTRNNYYPTTRNNYYPIPNTRSSMVADNNSAYNMFPYVEDEERMVIENMERAQELERRERVLEDKLRMVRNMEQQQRQQQQQQMYQRIAAQQAADSSSSRGSSSRSSTMTPEEMMKQQYYGMMGPDNSVVQQRAQMKYHHDKKGIVVMPQEVAVPVEAKMYGKQHDEQQQKDVVVQRAVMVPVVDDAKQQMYTQKKVVVPQEKMMYAAQQDKIYDQQMYKQQKEQQDEEEVEAVPVSDMRQQKQQQRTVYGTQAAKVVVGQKKVVVPVVVGQEKVYVPFGQQQASTIYTADQQQPEEVVVPFGAQKIYDQQQQEQVVVPIGQQKIYDQQQVVVPQQTATAAVYQQQPEQVVVPLGSQKIYDQQQEQVVVPIGGQQKIYDQQQIVVPQQTATTAVYQQQPEVVVPISGSDSSIQHKMYVQQQKQQAATMVPSIQDKMMYVQQRKQAATMVPSIHDKMMYVQQQQMVPSIQDKMMYVQQPMVPTVEDKMYVRQQQPATMVPWTQDKMYVQQQQQPMVPFTKMMYDQQQQVVVPMDQQQIYSKQNYVSPQDAAAEVFVPFRHRMVGAPAMRYYNKRVPSIMHRKLHGYVYGRRSYYGDANNSMMVQIPTEMGKNTIAAYHRVPTSAATMMSGYATPTTTTDQQHEIIFPATEATVMKRGDDSSETDQAVEAKDKSADEMNKKQQKVEEETREGKYTF